MLGTYKNLTNIESYINTAFKLYKASIIKNFLAQVNDEELKGENCRQYNFSFYLAVYLVTIVYQDVIKYPSKSWDYFVTKYDLEKYKKCLACDGIKLDDILISFTLPPVAVSSGINNLQIEKTFEIEPTDLTPIVIEPTIVDLSTILVASTCINNIETIC